MLKGWVKMSKYQLGIDIGGTFIKYALVDEDYHIVEKWKVPAIKFDTKDEFYDYLCSNCKELQNIDFIGISAPGLIDAYSNVKSYAAPNVRIMYGTNVNNEVATRTNKRVATINDAKSAGLCELKIGNAKGSKSSAFLIIGTGTGGCICNSEDVIYGKDGFAAEFHHMPFINFKTNKIDRQGDYCSMTALIKIYNDKVEEIKSLKYGHEVTEMYLKGDSIAKESVDEWINNMSTQLVTVTTFYNPEVICVGGGISEEEWFLELIQKNFRRVLEEFGTPFLTTEIKRCKYNNDANILGAIINAKMHS